MPWRLAVYYPTDHFPDRDEVITNAAQQAPAESGLVLASDERELFFDFQTEHEARAALERVTALAVGRTELITS